MAYNNSHVGSVSLMEGLSFKIILVQVLVIVFLGINFMLLSTFFMKEVFYTSLRYILFAVTLLSDCAVLLLTGILAIWTRFHFTVPVWLCLIIFILATVYTLITPFTLTAMTIERYVAICMPLRHGELCSTRCSLHCILIIHGLSSIPVIVDLAIFCLSVPLSFYKKAVDCRARVFILYKWQEYIRSAIKQFYFLLMCIVIVFTYAKIMKAAKAASGENKKSTWKGLKTVVLHAFQLLLCLIQLWCPFIEAAVLQIDFMLFIHLRFSNYILFYLASRCLSPLIYGLRDELFFSALKYQLCGLHNTS
ncbi:odorant receptor 131-2-like [Cheilinus undulatus]|uniref:odorant receptor 131-2-like n=1 Tax=Cheilinus undulatus TaxID=241271 RepID=UPI001BD6C12A|nr:odorant receptor 131-2-like [Cheilinus undulatus]